MIFQLRRTENITTDSTPAPPSHREMLSCPPMPVDPIPIPEYIAENIRSVNPNLYPPWITAYNEDPYIFMTTDNYQAIQAICNAPGPGVAAGAVRFWLQSFTCSTSVSLSYVGYDPPPPPPPPPPGGDGDTSVPGIVIEDTGGGYPTIPEPPILPEIDTRVKRHLEEQEEEPRKCYDRITGQIRGLIDYGIDHAAPIIDKVKSRIDANIVNTMGEVYSAAYPIGLGIPSTDQIITGEPVYSPYGIGASMPLYPDCQSTPPPESRPRIADESGYLPPQTPPPTPTPTQTPTQSPTCPAPIVQCPAPPAINFAPNIVVNIPQADGTDVTVNVAPSTPYTPSPSPYPSPSPSPTPTPDGGESEDEGPPIPDPSSPDFIDQVEAYDNFHGQPEKLKYTPAMDWSTTSPCLSFRENANEVPTNWAHVLFGVSRKPHFYNQFSFLRLIPLVGVPLADGLYNWTAGFATIVEAIPNIIFGAPGFQAVPSFLTLTVAGFLDKYLGIPALYLARGFQYDLNYIFPQTIPSETDFVNLFLSGFIDERTLECMVRANGSHYSWYKKLVGANRTRPNNEQIIQLNRRGILGDEQAWHELRGNGVVEQFDRDLLYRASEALPTVSDIVRFMVRDADDAEVAAKYGTDAKLDEKYGQQLQSWARGQGITDQVMKYYWRSHWEIPSNTQLFEMLHRLRPDRKTSKVPADAVVTIKDIEDALVVNDTLPYWARRMIEISYKPLTRTDTQRAYFIDALTEDELYDSYMDLGYNADNATRLVRFTNQLKARKKQAVGGSEKATSVLKYYKSWLISDKEATERLKSGGLSDVAAKDALEIARLTRKNDSQLMCIKGIHSQFRRYIIDDFETRHELTILGVPVENITPMVESWKCERALKPKELTAAQVCKAYNGGLISKNEYLRRLGLIGYAEDEAGILFELCTMPPPAKTGKKNAEKKPKTVLEKMAQTEAARAITAAALTAAEGLTE